MAITQNHVINIQPGVSAPLVIHCSQGDTGTQINLTVVNGDEEFDCSSYACSVHGVRSDGGNWGPITCTVNGNTVCFSLTSAMTAVAGACLAEISVGTVGTANFAMLIENATFGNGVTYSNDVSVYQNILNAVQAEKDERIAAVTNEKDERIAAVNAEATARQTADNTLQGNINSEASTRASADSNLQSQINQIVAPSGEAPSAAEVQNARIGTDGVTYDTLGTAIRTQVNNLKEHLVNYSVKLDRFKQEKLFAIKSGENFVVRSEDGTNMTPAYLKFFNSNGQQLGQYSLHDYHTPKRNITYTGDDSYYITIAGGTAQNIIVEKVDDNLNYYFSNTAEKYIYDNALKVHLGELNLKKDFNARIGDIIVCESTNGDDFTVQFLTMFDEHGQQCANYSLRDYYTAKRFFVFDSSNGNDCTKIKLSNGTAQDVVIYNLSLTANEYYYENISQLTDDVDVIHGKTENFIVIRNLYELYPFNASKGDTISFSSLSGLNMTPDYIRFYSPYGKEISYRSLKDFHTNLRTVTYENDEQIKYIALTGGTAQNIIVKNISKSIRDVINDQTSVINRNNLMLKSLDVTEKVKEYQSKISNGLSNESFIFFTDAHTMQHDYTNSVNKSSYQIVNNYLIDKIKTYKDNTCVDFVIDGGDWLQDSDTAEDAKLRLCIVSGKCKTLGKCYHLVGNHDTNYQGSTTLDNETITNIIFRDFGKTYYSFNGKNTKFYCLNSGLDNKSTLNDFDNEQIEWLCSSLAEDSSENIAICTHIWWNADAKTVFSNAITNIVNTYNNRGTYGTHNFANSRGKIKFVLSGHTHKDLTETLATGTVVVSSINSGYGNNSFDMVYADYSNSKLYFVRVGVGENREFDLIN